VRCYLTLQRNGQFMLTKYKPLIERVKGTRHEDVYMIPGEPLGIRHLCRGGVLMITGGNIKVQELALLDSIEIHLTALVE